MLGQGTSQVSGQVEIVESERVASIDDKKSQRNISDSNSSDTKRHHSSRWLTRSAFYWSEISGPNVKKSAREPNLLLLRFKTLSK